MKFVALISGGKDSFFNIHHCVSRGHELAALANLYPQQQEQDEIDSFMFQTVGHDIIDHYQECLDVPLYRKAISGTSSNVDLEYQLTQNDEIEDLYCLLADVKSKHPEIQGVSCGAILSHYQRTRVENVCDRLGLTSLTFLWQRNQLQLMSEMCQNNLDARIIKVAAIGLTENHLGKPITEMLPTMIKLNQLYDVHICGEGGEFETIVLDSPIFKHKKLQVVEQQVIKPATDGVAYLKYKVEVIKKPAVANFELIEAPALLSEDFTDILHELELPIDSTVDPATNKPEPLVIKPTITTTATKSYLSNFVAANPATSTTIESQTRDIFSQLSSALASIPGDVNFTHIQHMTLLLSNMNQFADINAIYSTHFAQQYLPPSRICVQTTLPPGYLAQLSCIVLHTKGNSLDSIKQGIHIRSRSYWAPQNIGPYSQSIVEKRQDAYQAATLSGQIPLVPASMELTSIQNSGDSAVLALQHLHRVMQLINVTQVGYVICFVTSEAMLSVAAQTLAKYCDSQMESDWQRRFVIVEVEKLPKNASVEWGGLSYKNIESMYDDDSDDESEELQLNQLRLDDFEVRHNFTIGKRVRGERMEVSILHTNKVESILNLIDTLKVDSKVSQVQIMCKLSLIGHLQSHGGNIEYLPVSNTWSYTGERFDYTIIIKSE